MNATTNRYDELSPKEQLEIDDLINTIAAARFKRRLREAGDQ
jgi:hypothetical protein